MLNSVGKVDKGWGQEIIWASTDKYCGKFMQFKSGSKCSMHFHTNKDETWYILSGKFKVKYTRTATAAQFEKDLIVGDTWNNPPNFPHQIICIETGTILEVSTPDHKEDNYRIEPGDSQK
jgi:mannose-6-phosphate isomerase-like protein (cupin superfamily)